jgi:hypothetical protein
MPTISKGSVLSADVATVLTAMAEVISIDHSGAESETFKYTNLNTSGAGHEYLATGYSEGGTVDAEIWFLPATASQQIFTDEITTPTTVVANQLDGQITFADTGATTMPFKIAGVGIGVSVAMDDGVKLSVSLKTNGLPTYAT